VTLEVHASDAASIEIDPIRIREVIGNLVSNALRPYTPQRINSHSGRRDAGGRRTRDAGGVHDTAAGMTPDDLTRAFDRFYKGSEFARLRSLGPP